MERAQLLKSKEYHIFHIQNHLFNVIENYRKKKNINKSQLAQQLGFNKSYITQVLNGDFDHKISKLVELSLASGKAPILSFVDIERFIKEDADDKVFELIPMLRAKPIAFEKERPYALATQIKPSETKTPATLTINSSKESFSMPL